MKKILLASVAGAGLLASCGGTVITGGAVATLTNIKTEYRTQDNRYVACGNVLENGAQQSANNQVAIYFDASGEVDTINLNLRGNTDSTFDGNYSKTLYNTDYTALNNNSYKVIFDAKPETGLLPQAIVVNPVKRTVKIVTVDNYAGSFYAALTLNSNGQSGTATTKALPGGNIPVYSNCYVQIVTDETL